MVLWSATYHFCFVSYGKLVGRLELTMKAHGYLSKRQICDYSIYQYYCITMLAKCLHHIYQYYKLGKKFTVCNCYIYTIKTSPMVL